MNRLRTLPLVALALGFALAQPPVLRAHSGPPFPIVDEQPMPGYVVSIWADPDIGEATFFVVLEPDPSAAHVAIAGVEITVQPVSGRLPKAVYRTTREDARTSVRFTAQPELDIQEMWRVAADIRLVDGSTQTFTSEVEATPPGGGIWGLVIFLIPFLLFGGLWALVFVRRSRAAAARARASRPRCEAISSHHPPLPPTS